MVCYEVNKNRENETENPENPTVNNNEKLFNLKNTKTD